MSNEPQNPQEQRIAELEREVARLRLELARETGAVTGSTAPDFLERFVGIHADSPAFERVVRDIEERRQREKEEAEGALTPETTG
jgi:hypothetical protein